MPWSSSFAVTSRRAGSARTTLAVMSKRPVPKLIRAARKAATGRAATSKKAQVKELARQKELESQVAALRASVAEKTQQIARIQKQMSKQGQRIESLVDLLGELMDARAGVDGPAYKTSQENVWSSDHGFRYVIHHMSEDWQNNIRIPVWTLFLAQVPDVSSICEFGCNIGANLKAIHHVKPDIALTGIEINPHAVYMLQKEDIGDIHCASILDAEMGQQYDLVFTRGVLIHIHPDEVAKVMHNMARHAKRYVLIYEIYSADPHALDRYKPMSKEAVPDEEYQFWRDFSGDFQALYPDWRVVATGVNDTLDQAPKEGDMHWTIFSRP